MPTTEPMIQPISAPILVPGTQQEPTVPIIHLDNHTNGSDTSSTSSGSGHDVAAPALARISLSGGNYHRQKGNINQHHHYNAHNPNSSLRRLSSIGNTKKLTIENTALKAKVVELERYLTERKVELSELNQHIQKCEFELGSKILECEDLKAKLGQGKELEQGLSIQGASDEQRDKGGKEESESGDIDKDSKGKVLQEENARKDVQIAELLEKVDRLGTQVLILEREKARFRQPPTPPAEGTPGDVTSAVASSIKTAATLKDVIPITAEAVIVTTTPHSPIRNLAAGSPGGHVSASGSHTRLNTDNSSWSATQIDQDHDNFSQDEEYTSTAVNSASYDLAQEHSKLLTKYQALRMQHAQASVYVEELENEIRELKVQGLDVNSGQDPAAH
ncbi:MAG: hypothetical protein J3Q66DRAFT_405748 [Benniella sp.]|nr:MAG: hypothetical protein J3Q66DRAFT_405748 [Benniella sp.]